MEVNPTERPTIAFLGAGAMGAPMITRLVGAGFGVRAWNRSSEKLTPLVELGAIAAATPGAAATDANILITMLPDGPTTEQVVFNDDAVLSGLASGATWLQMGTVGVEATDHLMARIDTADVQFVDAPVSGSVAPAVTGDLLILASGPPAVHDAATPIFDVLGRRTYWLGAAGAGSRVKLVLNNWLVDLVEMVVETLNFASELGIDPATIVNILEDVPIGSPYAVAKARTMLSGDFSPGFALKHAVKDAVLSLEIAKEHREKLSLTASFIARWQQAMVQGAGDEDLSVVYDYVGA
ncbi:MAG TPA: NAD(P)-dependent oxidoreductase [Acidimicrobiales bacterium]